MIEMLIFIINTYTCTIYFAQNPRALILEFIREYTKLYHGNCHVFSLYLGVFMDRELRNPREHFALIQHYEECHNIHVIPKLKRNDVRKTFFLRIMSAPVTLSQLPQIIVM